MRRHHPKKEVEEVLRYGESLGWHIRLGGAHRWGRLECGSGCHAPVWSTPRDPGDLAKDLRRTIRK